MFQDPVGLAGGMPNMYAYVSDSNTQIDPFGLTAELYKLVATKDGFYDVFEYKNSKSVGKTWLKEGEVWKFGETKNFRVRADGSEIQSRYSQTWLTQNNLEYKTIQSSPNKSAKRSFQIFETQKIKKYFKRFGKLPAGNKCCH